MSQLTRQDVAEVVEEVLGRVLDRKLDERLDARFSTFEDRLDKKFDTRLSTFEDRLDKKFDHQLGAFIEHFDDKFDSLTEAVSLMNTTMGTLARQSDLEEVKDDVKTIKYAVKETNEDLHRLEDRFDRFELSRA